MRIGIIAPPWVPIPPDGYGGIEGVIDGLARGLQDIGHDVVLVTTGDSTCPVPVVATRERAATDKMCTTFIELEHIIAAYDALTDCDIIHDHTMAGPFYAARFPERAVVTTNHGPFDSEFYAIGAALSGHIPIIAISENQRQQGEDAGIEVETMIHHGVDAQQFEFGEGGDYYAFLGRMVPEKGPHHAARIAKEAGVPLKIAGRCATWEMEWFKAEVEPYLGGDIEFVGEVGLQGKGELLRNAKAFINPITWEEPFGMVMIESLACGTPVIAYGHGSAPELIDNGVTGFVCGDDTEMLKAINQIETIDRSACRQVVERHFTIQRMAAEHVATYERVISRREGK